LRAEQVKSFLLRLYRSQQGTRRTSVLLLGGPGIGKTTAVEEAARELASEAGREFVDYDDRLADRILGDPEKYFVFHNLPLVGVEPVDLTGHPRLDDGRVKYFPLAWAEVMSRCPGMLFLDDFLDTQRPDVMSAAYRITLERRIGYVRLHPDVQVVAASNTPEYSVLSQMMPPPLANRLAIVQVDPPTVKEWAGWMDRVHGEKWDRRVLAYLMRFEDHLFRPPKETETLQEFGSPRSWTALALALANRVNGSEVFEAFVGPELAVKFKAFLETEVDLEELLSRPEGWGRLSVDAKYIVSLMLANLLPKKGGVEKALPLLEKMEQEEREWLVNTVLLMPSSARGKVLSSLAGRGEKVLSALEQVIRDSATLLEEKK